VNNVLFDDPNERYKMITAQVKDLCFGLYGETAEPIDPALQKKALKGYKGGETPITCRPAESLAPELETAKAAVKDLTDDPDDVLIYALYPVTGKRFLNWKYGKEAPPPETKPKTMEAVRAEAELMAKAKAGKLVEKAQKEIPPKGKNLRMFNVYVDDTYYEVGVEPAGGTTGPVEVRSVTPGRIRVEAKPASKQPPSSAQPQPAKKPEAVKPKSKPDRTQAGTPLEAPMPGMIIRFEKQVGDSVKEGETVVVLEAMKMENALASPAAGTIKQIFFESGDSVARGDVLCLIE
jgi:biotin carboxyl carrier protein